MILNGVLTFSLIVVAGFLPALLWLWLLLKEDREHPEPRMRLIMSFLVGMVAVALVLPVQLFVVSLSLVATWQTVFLAGIEEVAKFGLAFWFALRTKDTDEPIDEVIYMVTVALGFAALENSFFLASPLIEKQYISSLVIAHARFLGSTLVHIAASGMVGISLAHAFNKKNKTCAIIIGLLFATTLHSVYNLLIINNDKHSIIVAFLGLWILCLVLVYIVNYLKHSILKTHE